MCEKKRRTPMMEYKKLITEEEYNQMMGTKSLESFQPPCHKVKDLMKDYREEFNVNQKVMFNFITVKDYTNTLTSLRSVQ